MAPKQTTIPETEPASRRIIAAAAELRRSSGLKQVEMARRTEWTQGNVSRFEKATDANLSTLVTYLDALGLTVTFT